MLKKRTSQIPTVLAEKNLLGAELLSSALKRCQNYFEVVGQALASGEAVRYIDQLQPEIALVSIDLSDGETAGYRVLKHIREHHPSISAVALLDGDTREAVLAAFQSGARGVVSRSQNFRLIAKCLRKVHEGQIWASSDQIVFLFEALHRGEESRLVRNAPETLHQLTPRELDVARQVAEGMRNSEIGEKLGVSEHTVRNYIMRIYDKLGVSNRVQLTRQCSSLFESDVAN
jgi:DNA-binding NarL/FixJ family response regulator